MLDLHFENDGLIPVVVQEEQTREVLLVAFMNEAALQRTLETGLAHFWSRSRGTLWMKGESSGQVQEVVGLYVNCEENSLLLRVKQHGMAACHEGYFSCYYRKLNEQGTWEVIAPRLFDPA
ncbi:MAG TPA: phosphoribosyl-AMP cyclohydrolase, partial [Ktedonobacterales bacterium]